MTILHRFSSDLTVCGTPISGEITGVARVVRVDSCRWRITSIVLDGKRGHPAVMLPHGHALYAAIAAWLCEDRRADIEAALRQHDERPQWSDLLAGAEGW